MLIGSGTRDGTSRLKGGRLFRVSGAIRFYIIWIRMLKLSGSYLTIH